MKLRVTFGVNEMPTTKDEWSKVVECITEIKHLKENLERIEKILNKHINEEKETKQFITTKRLTILMIIATLSGSVLGGIILWLLTKYYP